MLTRLVIRNFKRFADVDIELGGTVVFVGPNNAGKTTALQALALWNAGVQRWIEKRSRRTEPERRPGVAINRRDLLALPVPSANLLWRNLHVRETRRGNGAQRTENVRIDVLVEGVSRGREWQCGLEFDYANEESFYCRPLREPGPGSLHRMPVPEEAGEVRVAYLPPMSGLAANEVRLDVGAIDVRLGEGRTAELLRNLCYMLSEGSPNAWERLRATMERMFGVELEAPQYIQQRGEIVMRYRDTSHAKLDLACAGRGFQQSLLLVAHMLNNPGRVILVDEPDAHLEILRQREAYELLSTLAREYESQLIMASHSEVVLNEAADRDVVVAFVGRPHRIDDRGSQVAKALKEIGFDQYYQAEETGWVLYLEGATDLAILRAFAEVLNHPACRVLERPFVHYVLNQPQAARSHFNGLRVAKHDLVGFALFDRSDRPHHQDHPSLIERCWERREIENYVSGPGVLERWTSHFAREQVGSLFEAPYLDAMRGAVATVERALADLGKGNPWSGDCKVSDEFLDPVFARFFEALNLPHLLRKSDYHELARFVQKEELDPEVSSVLDQICDVAGRAVRPADPNAM